MRSCRSWFVHASASTRVMLSANRNIVRQVIVPVTDPPPVRFMMISIVMSSRASYLLKMPLPGGDVKTIQPPHVACPGTVNAPPKEPTPCSTSEPPTPPSQNFHVKLPVIETPLASPF